MTTKTMGSVEAKLDRALRDTDCSLNMIAAVRELARAVDAHLAECPHVEPPVARSNLEVVRRG